MARRRRNPGEPSLVSEVFGSLLRLSHRVPVIGLIVALLLGVLWWWLRQRPDAAFGSGRILAIVVAVVAAVFLFLALVGFARNLFPETEESRQRRRG